MRSPALLLVWTCITVSAQQHFFLERIGMLGVNRLPATWSAPESVVRDLRSDDRAVRRRAQRLLGVNEDFFSDDGAEVIGLQYFSQGAAGKPVVMVRAKHGAFEYAAIAVPSSGGWKRLAVFECFCKYDNDPSFVDIGYGPLDYGQAVVTVHASGGGTGDYEQTEAWFGLRDDNLVTMLSFARRKRSCQPETPCTYRRRWFVGNQLIEGKISGKGPQVATLPKAPSTLWESNDREINSFSCTPYEWDAVNLKYGPSGDPHPCKFEPPR